MRRKKISTNIKCEIFYKSASTCCLCRNQSNLVIHHIDKNRSNNNLDNLVALCPNCHDNTHTRKELTLNRSEKELKKIRNKWYEEVKKRSTDAIINQRNPFDPLERSIINWVYFNFAKLPAYFENYHIHSNKSSDYKKLRTQNILYGDYGKISFQKKIETKEYLTIFDHFEFDSANALNRYYTKMVNQLIKKNNPFILNEKSLQTKKGIKSLLKNGMLGFMCETFYFKKIKYENGNETRRMHTKKKILIIEGGIETKNMFGSTTISTTCFQRSNVAVFFFIKDIDCAYNKKYTKIYITPLAIASSFHYDVFNQSTPYILKTKRLFAM